MRLHSSSVAVAALAVFSGLALTPRISSAQVAGTTSKPIPDVLLLVDTSGSMERMTDGTSPDDPGHPAACVPGTLSTPNKWGMLVQALTGNMQPYFSCESMPRAAGSLFAREFQINGQAPYDVDYALNYHRPLTGDALSQCVLAPYKLPGASAGGVGPAGGLFSPSSFATDFPDDALTMVSRSYLNGQLTSNSALPTPIPSNAECLFAQAPDGQLDAAKDFVRFALMTFDNDTDPSLGMTGSFSGNNFVQTSPPSTTAVARPFLGQWSYLRHGTGATEINPFFVSPATDTITGGATGRPFTNPECAFSLQEVGARNEAAPPWEGRLVKFPKADASIYDLERQNEQLQKVLIASRPYGATPIDGMFDDARDYYLSYENGPGSASGDDKDPYKCRPRYIVLLTDGAPNLDLRPSCNKGSTSDMAGNQCPYPDTAAKIAGNLAGRTGPEKVLTYVIGFAVSGEGSTGTGFPASLAVTKRNCKSWYEDSSGGAGSPTQMQAVCASTASATPGTTAGACCKLNDLALAGSTDAAGTNQVGAFFAESQADVVLAFGRILANITQSASTRTVPAFTPTAQYSAASFGGVANTNIAGRFVASFVPNTQRPWSGDVDRTRYQCTSGFTATDVPQSTAAGDSEAFNLATQTVAGQRTIISVVGKKLNTAIDSAATIRPYANPSTATSTGPDNLTAVNGDSTYAGTEVAMLGPTLGFQGADWAAALNIDKNTCKRSRAVLAGNDLTRGTQIVPALDDATTGPARCTDVVWGFATAYAGPQVYPGNPTSASYNFNVRCNGSSATTGKCSVSGSDCTIGGPIPPSSGPPVATNGCSTGEVCVPACSALGAIYHSNPVVVGPPNDFLREEGFRQYAAARRSRIPVTYVASIDGLLHAFKAMEPGGPALNHELWAFAPPAVLPRLASNYPQGNQVLLDGTPVVAETIWDRGLTGTSGADVDKQWHTTLVAGLGGGGGGYYALNVTDADCGTATGNGTAACLNHYNPPTGTDLNQVANSTANLNVGPHFLWQLTDVVAGSGTETAKIKRTSTIMNGTNKVNMMSLFGKNTSTPAIGMMQIGARQVGVAILPGGYDDPPAANSATCTRYTQPYPMADLAVGLTRPSVRQWGAKCDSPVPGRGVTIVRLDNGEIIRHFGRKLDTPLQVQNKIGNETFFDSPMTGTPVVYPSGIGVPIQKIFIGDADGTLWRIDVSNTDKSQWSASLFQDLYATNGGGAKGQPVAVSPVLSMDETSNLVINVATGDQDSIIRNDGEQDFLFSISELRDATSNAPKAKVNWYKRFLYGERVTGPMVVFDRTLYFATYAPTIPSSAACTDVGSGKLWGLDYAKAKEPSSLDSGGDWRWCKLASVDPTTGNCSASLQDTEGQGPALIPGVSLQTSTSCAQTGAVDAEYGAGGYQSMTPVSYSITFGQGQATSSTSSTPQAARASVKRQLPSNSTKIDSWSIVIE